MRTGFWRLPTVICGTLVAGVLALGLGQAASAATFSETLTPTPGGTGNCTGTCEIVIKVTDTAAGKVDMEIDLTGLNDFSFVDGGEGITFNTEGFVSDLMITSVSDDAGDGFTDPTLTTSENNQNLSGGTGKFDHELDFTTCGQGTTTDCFSGGDIMTVGLMGTGLTAESLVTGLSSMGFCFGAHVEDSDVGGGDSDTLGTATCGAGTGAPIPEPSALLLFGTGLIGLVFFARRRRSAV